MNKNRFFSWMIVLAFLAGFINAITILSIDGATVSHVTGMFSKFAIAVCGGALKECLGLLSVIGAFFCGAVVAGIATGEKAFRLRKIYGWIVIAIGILVLLPMALDAVHRVLLLAFVMGLQNGMVVSFKGILIRTTHMTGNLTDFGVFIGYRIRGNKKEPSVSGLVPGITLLSFCIGGIIGIGLDHWMGDYAFIVASGIYVLLGIMYSFFQKNSNDKNLNGIPDDQE